MTVIIFNPGEHPLAPRQRHQCGLSITDTTPITDCSSYAEVSVEFDECGAWFCPGCQSWMPWCWGHGDCGLCDECCDGSCMPEARDPLPAGVARDDGRPLALIGVGLPRGVK